MRRSVLTVSVQKMMILSPSKKSREGPNGDVLVTFQEPRSSFKPDGSVFAPWRVPRRIRGVDIRTFLEYFCDGQRPIPTGVSRILGVALPLLELETATGGTPHFKAEANLFGIPLGASFYEELNDGFFVPDHG